MSTKFYTLLTDIGAAKLASAAALGVPLKITHMAVGDGGGALPTPDAKQTALVNEKRRAALNMLYIDPQNSSQIIAEQVIPENEGGWWIREVGLFDESGALIAVGNCPESYKPQLAEGSGRTQTVRMVLITSSTDNITLKIDPAVVLATRKYVDDKISEHEQSRRHPDASLTAKGFTQLSSATNSESEILAATPKAVKAAYDLAAGKASASHTHPWNQITGVPAASLTVKGTVQLSSATNSTSETQAATPKAVKAAYDLAAGKAPVSHTHPWNQITGVPAASLTVKGTVQLSSATITITREDGDSHRFTLADRGAYTGVIASWLHTREPAKKESTAVKRKRRTKKQKKEPEAKQGDYLVGTDENVLVLNRTYANRSNAERAAKMQWERLQRGVASFSLQLAEGRADLYTEMPVKVSGFKQLIDDAEWTITTLTHTVSPDNGFTTSLELEVRIDDFEME
ncbi:phage tail protein [Escherichia coli]|nr:phage tail protein [Escherichia coli]MDY8271458.1 phage tail protein [Escherichia coli]